MAHGAVRTGKLCGGGKSRVTVICCGLTSYCRNKCRSRNVRAQVAGVFGKRQVGFAYVLPTSLDGTVRWRGGGILTWVFVSVIRL